MFVGQVVGKMPAPHLRRNDASLVDSETLLGVEVEVEGVTKKLSTKFKETAYWTAKEDGSLRNNGMEFVFSEPLFGADVVSAVKFLCQQAKEHNYRVSVRTGIHTHMDVRGMELDKFQNLCIIYALTEKLFYNWIGDKRSENIHCLPWYAADADLDTIGAIFRDPNSGLSYVKALHRYSGLNLNSLVNFGTVEFRQLKTTFDYSRIMDWLNIILSMKKAAIAWQGSPTQLVTEMKLLGAYAFSQKVFGPDLTAKMWYPGFQQDFRGICLPTAQHILDCSTPPGTKASSLFDRYKQSYDEEAGNNPGLAKWKKRNKVQKTPVAKQAAYSSLQEDMVATWNTVVFPPVQPVIVELEEEFPIQDSDAE